MRPQWLSILVYGRIGGREGGEIRIQSFEWMPITITMVVVGRWNAPLFGDQNAGLLPLPTPLPCRFLSTVCPTNPTTTICFSLVPQSQEKTSSLPYPEPMAKPSSSPIIHHPYLY